MNSVILTLIILSIVACIGHCYTIWHKQKQEKLLKDTQTLVKDSQVCIKGLCKNYADKVDEKNKVEKTLNKIKKENQELQVLNTTQNMLITEQKKIIKNEETKFKALQDEFNNFKPEIEKIKKRNLKKELVKGEQSGISKKDHKTVIKEITTKTKVVKKKKI